MRVAVIIYKLSAQYFIRLPLMHVLKWQNNVAVCFINALLVSQKKISLLDWPLKQRRLLTVCLLNLVLSKKWLIYVICAS